MVSRASYYKVKKCIYVVNVNASVLVNKTAVYKFSSQPSGCNPY